MPLLKWAAKANLKADILEKRKGVYEECAF